MAGVTWEAPGPGSWSTDRSHNDRPITGFNAAAGNLAMRQAMAEGFAMVGVAIGMGESAVVNGWAYGQIHAAGPSTYPDLEVAAKDFLANHRWVDRIATWEDVRRPERLAECTELQSVDVTALDDPLLVEHLTMCMDAQRRGSRIHFEQHGLCVIIGELILSCREWGIDEADVLPLLDGHSKASSRTAGMIDDIANAVARAGVRPETVDDVRNASDEAAAALDVYLSLHGNVPVAGFDFDARTLNEMPDLVVRSIHAALDRRDDAKPADETPDARLVRERVPSDQRARFDDLLQSSREVYGIRDDDVHFSLWCRGLSRRALIEVGGRLAERRRLYAPEHVLDITPDEVARLLIAGADDPAAGAVAARFAQRAEQARLLPPPMLGDAPTPLPFDDMPPAVRRMTQAMTAYSQLRRARRGVEPFTGTGIGTTRYRGRAVVAANADEAFERVEPGDVLVTVLTTPAFNAVLPLCGGLVVEDAGILSHAAVTARELGIPAVVGVANATALIPDGAPVELDPAAGRVRMP